MQNELGVGQDLALSAVVEAGGTGELVAAVNPFWAKYLPGFGISNPQPGIPPVSGDPATLINPNPYLDVAGITALRDAMFSGDWFEFKITSPQQARSWLEDQILKPLGLVMVVTASGQLTLKAMKNPANQTPVLGFTQRNIVGIPEVRLAPVINALAYRLDADDAATNTSARTYNTTVTMLQQASYNLFRYLYNHQVEAAGLRTGARRYTARLPAGRPAFPALRFCHAGLSNCDAARGASARTERLGFAHPPVGSGLYRRRARRHQYPVRNHRPLARLRQRASALHAPGYAPGQHHLALRNRAFGIHGAAAVLAGDARRAGDILLHHAVHEWCVHGGAFDNLLKMVLGARD